MRVSSSAVHGAFLVVPVVVGYATVNGNVAIAGSSMRSNAMS